MQKKITAQQFKKEYADLRDKFGGVKEKLAQIKKELTPLRRDANRLFKKSERNLYEDSNCGCRPAFSGLGKCMENLIDWAEAWDIVAEAARFLPAKRSAR